MTFKPVPISVTLIAFVSLLSWQKPASAGFLNDVFKTANTVNDAVRTTNAIQTGLNNIFGTKDEAVEPDNYGNSMCLSATCGATQDTVTEVDPYSSFLQSSPRQTQPEYIPNDNFAAEQAAQQAAWEAQQRYRNQMSGYLGNF